MQRCLELAQLGAGAVAPNPMVGAVLVHNDIIIGEGYHQQFGHAHAEVNCINSVSDENKELIAASTLYVSLEPCSHFGKTPPCTDLIIENKIPTVIIGCKDSYAEVNGKGIAKLEASGVNVITGILEKESQELNRRFFTFHQHQRPYIILKWAQSSDKKIGAPSKPPPKGETSEDSNASRLLISNEQTNRLVHKWRSEEAAIMVGTNTALLDDPALTTRLWPGRNPIRLVIDMELKLPASLKLLDSKARTIVFNGQKQEEGELLSYCKIENDGNAIQQILSILYDLKLQSLIVEGGAKLLQSFIDEGLWDEARIICNGQMTIGNGVNAPELPTNKPQSEMQIGTDTIATYLPTA